MLSALMTTSSWTGLRGLTCQLLAIVLRMPKLRWRTGCAHTNSGGLKACYGRAAVQCHRAAHSIWRCACSSIYECEKLVAALMYVCVCVRVCVHTHNTNTHTTQTPTQTHTHTHTHIHIHIHTHAHAHIPTRSDVWVWVWVYLCVCACTFSFLAPDGFTTVVRWKVASPQFTLLLRRRVILTI
jgi:hypothetical protein